MILDKIHPTVRKDCNYSNLEKIKQEAVWSDEQSRWRVPDLIVQKTKLPPAGKLSFWLKLSVHAAQTCLEQLIFIFLGQRALRRQSEKSESDIRALKHSESTNRAFRALKSDSYSQSL